jgi:hypothetical protein
MVVGRRTGLDCYSRGYVSAEFRTIDISLDPCFDGSSYDEIQLALPLIFFRLVLNVQHKAIMVIYGTNNITPLSVGSSADTASS